MRERDIHAIRTYTAGTVMKDVHVCIITKLVYIQDYHHMIKISVVLCQLIKYSHITYVIYIIKVSQCVLTM